MSESKSVSLADVGIVVAEVLRQVNGIESFSVLPIDVKVLILRSCAAVGDQVLTTKGMAEAMQRAIDRAGGSL